MAAPSSLPSTASGGVVSRMRGALEGVGSQPAVRRALPAILILTVTALAIGVWMALREPPQMALYPGIAEAEKARIMEALTGAGIQAEIDAATGEVEVARADYHRARMALAAQGLPQSAPEGGALLDNLPLGASRSVEAARLRQAQETELARSIAEIGAVNSARVHLALPERSAFLRDSHPPRASVFLQIARGRALDQGQVEAIVNLVSSSVPGMARSDVSVVDQMGRLLSRGSDDSGALLDDRRLQSRLRLESVYRNRIEALLTPVVGPENLSVQVTLDMDFTRSEITEERVDPNEAALLSEQQQMSESRDRPAGGIPGAIANTPPDEAALTKQAPEPAAGEADGKAAKGDASIRSRSSGTTRNYEVSRTLRKTTPPRSRATRVTAAVVVRAPAAPAAPAAEGQPADEVQAALAPELLADLEKLTRSAIGFDEARGDSVTILAQPFAEPMVQPEPALDLDWLPETLRQVGLVAALAIVALGIVRPMLSRLLPAHRPGSAAPGGLESGMIEVGEGETLEGLQARLEQQRHSLAEAALGAHASREQKYAVLRQVAAEDPTRIAMALRRMIKDEIDKVK